MMMREKKLFSRKARLDNFDYDEISLGSEESSPHVEMALLSHTLQYLTEDNLRETNTNRAEDKITSEFTSSCSLYPQILPTGLCNSYLSEDTIPQTCLTTSMDHKYSDENMNMDEKARLVTNDNFNTMSEERNSSRITLNKQPDRTLSSFLLESQFYENLQIVSSAPVLSPVQENNLITDLRSYQARRRSTLKSTTENSVSNFVNFNLRASGCSSMLEPNSLRSHEFESDDWINGNWQTARKSDTLLVRFQFPLF